MQKITLNISRKNVLPVLFAKQGDVGRKFIIAFFDGDEEYLIPNGAVFSVWYSGASGESNYSSVGDRDAVTVEGNAVTVELITQMLTNAGEGTLCVIMNGVDGSQIGSWNIPYSVQSTPGSDSEEATQYYTAFSEAVANLPHLDNSLSISGRAADAKAVGDALAQKQPKGTYLDTTDKTLLLSGKAADAAAVGAALQKKAPAGYVDQTDTIISEDDIMDYIKSAVESVNDYTEKRMAFMD